MSNNGVAIQVKSLGKMYRIYDKPVDRLKQMLWGRHLAAGYGREFWALRDFSCTVRKGEMLGVIGRNGSGKSTLLQMVAGTLEPSTGSVQMRGRVSALLELGSGFNPDYSGRDNVFLAGAILGIGAEEMARRYDGIVAFAGIGNFIDQPVKTYSSGMTVRLAFAVASSIDPDILIVDEALAVGDLVFQQRCFHRFKEIRARGTSVLFVSHDLSSVVQYCDRAILLRDGGVLGEGSAKDMVDLYKRSLAADLACDEPASVPTEQRAAPQGLLSSYFTRSENCQEYGDGKAAIIDWGMLDSAGLPLRINDGVTSILVRIVVRFDHACADPIVAFTFRGLQGNELCGTNTLYEERPIGPVAAGKVVTVDFSFVMPLAAGPASLCIACTEFLEGGLAVHHRLYDVCLLETVHTRRIVGLFDLRSRIEIVRHV